ncbi:MAG: hypothetical protein QOD55_1389 [Solirubrobacteraceae bacterium]|nr:hypothetical protein [Solirubrobacteraceae bacterium]MEA2289392.1 hypothetical protein [Solirubrobacteraceae bacterium]
MSRTSSPSASSAAAAPGVAPESRAAIVCRPAATPEELAGHLSIRRRVFVEAQALFAGDDRDERDDDPATIHLVGIADGDVAGAVRLYPLDGEGRWQGDRLAVLPNARALQLGAELVRCAVATAGAAGGERMVALVQAQNVRFFERLGWDRDGAPTAYHGIEHQPMAIALGAAEAVRPPQAA